MRTRVTFWFAETGTGSFDRSKQAPLANAPV
jgi:hypothetical protein